MVEPLLIRIARGDSAAVGECINQFGALVWALVALSSLLIQGVVPL